MLVSILSRWYSYILLSLLALLLPVQKWSVAEINTAQAFTPTVTVTPGTKHTNGAHQLVNRTHSVPHSTQDVGSSSEAVIFQGRWTLALRSTLNDGNDDNSGESLGFEQPNSLVWLVPETSSHSHAAIRLPNIPYQHDFTDHRVSGWKESNALYVALNAQFS